MTFQILDQNEGRLSVEYKAPTEIVSQKWDQACRIIGKKAHVPGFRPGKAPLKLMKKYHSSSLIPWIQQNLFHEGYQQFLYEQNIKPFGTPEISNLSLEGNHFYCSWKMFTKPETKLKQYKNLEFSVPVSETAEMIADQLLLKLREECGKYEDYGPEDFVQDGDLIHYSLQLNDDEPKQNVFAVGSQNFPPELPNLSELFSGLMMQESKTWEKENQKYTLKLLSGQKKIPAELNDDLAKRVGLQNFVELEEKIAEQSQKFAAQNKKQKLNQAFLTKLLETNPVELPKWYQEMETIEIQKSFGEEWKQLSAEEQNFYYQRRLEQSKVSLLLEAIRETEPEVAFSDQELIALLKKKADATTSEGRAVLKTLNSPQKESLQQALAMLRDEMVIEWLLVKNKIV
jgi:trigger factor